MRDPYLYPDNDVLKNKFGIRDSERLKEIEANYTASWLKDLSQTPLEGDYVLNTSAPFIMKYFRIFMTGPGNRE